MKIKKIVSQRRRDFQAIYECEHCGNETEGFGYDDANFHNNVIPGRACEKCGKSASDDYDCTNSDRVIKAFEQRYLEENNLEGGHQMNIFTRIKLIFTYTGELEEVAKKIRYEKADAERLARLSHLKLCFEHQQERYHRHYSPENCDHCKAQNEIKNAKGHAAMLTKRINKNVK